MVMEEFWNASTEEQKQGFVEHEDQLQCLLCGQEVVQGLIYPVEDLFYDAKRYMRFHIEQEHGSVFDYLSHLDKKLTGLSDHQVALLRLFYQGLSDAQVQRETGIGSTSTIRNHRFVLKEKERQARVFLVMMDLLKEKDQRVGARTASPARARVNEQSPLKVDEAEQIIVKHFPQGSVQGRLEKLPRKQSHKRIVLQEIVKRFEPNRFYTEKEVNEVLKDVYEDHVTLRRYLIDFSLLEREADGSRYWLAKPQPQGKEDTLMNRKQELKMLYKETKTQAGVYQVKNVQNGKVLVESTRNLKTMNGKKFMMQQGNHPNPLLQKELKEYGVDAFRFEVLEVLEPKDEPYFDLADALEKLENKWLEQVQPYGERGYNQEKKRK